MPTPEEQAGRGSKPRGRMVGGIAVFLLLLLLGAWKRAQPTLPGCPSLSWWIPVNRVSVDVVRALDDPETMCIRAINGLPQIIWHGLSSASLSLEKWNQEQGKFLPFTEAASRIIEVPAVALWMLPGQTFDERLPYASHDLPPGSYRAKACFQFAADAEWTWREVACSKVFQLQ